MSWNPFRKADKTVARESKPEEVEEVCDVEEADEAELLPPVNDREDTQRVDTTLTELRLVHDKAADELKKTAKRASRSAQATQETLRSMPAFPVPPSLRTVGGGD